MLADRGLRVKRLPLPGLSIFRKHRFVVVVGERVVEPGFDDWPDRFGAVIAAHAGEPGGSPVRQTTEGCPQGCPAEGRRGSQYLLAFSCKDRWCSGSLWELRPIGLGPDNRRPSGRCFLEF